MPDRTLSEWFAEKPDTLAIFEMVRKRIDRCGPSSLTVGKQISFGATRKFAWFWLYNVTARQPQGILHAQFALRSKVDNGHVRNISQVGRARWNHQVVLRTLADARSAWLGDLINRAYEYGHT